LANYQPEISEVIDMTKQTTKPVGKKAVTAIASGKPKTSKAAVATIAKSPPEKKPAVKKPAVKKPLTKTAEKSTKTAAALPKKSTASVVKKAAIPAAEKIIPAKKTAEKKSKPAVMQKTVVKPNLEERYRMVELAAYFIAEQHGFKGRTDEYWAAAEHQIAARLCLQC
jgi:hypothetical protein